jgi:ADP-heptose:LPS heptosyltransferase/GT2 family glycosyltransferase
VPETPKTIVYLRPDTIGDLVLFTPALGLFLDAYPKARHVLVVREGYETLSPLFPASVEWKVARLNPFKQRPAECLGALHSLLNELDELKPDLILAPTLNRTWLELAVAAHFKGVKSVVLGDAMVDPVFAASLRLDLNLDPERAFESTVPAASGSGDVESQHHFAETVIGTTLERGLPVVRVSEAARHAADRVLSTHGLAGKPWVAVFPGGLANVSVKAWTDEGFSTVGADLLKDGVHILVMAHVSESAKAQSVAKGISALAGTTPPVWLGKDGEIELLAALLGKAAFYVGHDTGAMHLAAAVDTPVVGIFGGGHWPRFKPSARRSVAVVQPLPCFGCSWDCTFGAGPCVKTIPASDVLAAVTLLRNDLAAPLAEVVQSTALPSGAHDILRDTLPLIRTLKSDRLERQHKIEELKKETDSKDLEIADLKRAAEERKAEMEAIKAELEAECADKDKEIEELKNETNSKDLEIADLKKAAEERKAEMEAIKAELEAECADKDKEIEELKGEADTKDAEIAQLKETCNDREAVVTRLDAGLKAHIAAVPVWEQRVAKLTEERDALTKRLDLLGNFPPDAEIWAQAIRDKDVHIGNLETMIREKDLQLANYAGGYAGTEQAKHYGKLLSEKEAVIQQLHKACVEREKVITELAATSNRFTGSIRKLWIAAAAAYREEVARPIKYHLFKALVEKQEMQIGVLRQHDPKPLVWQKKFPSYKVPEERLPKIAMVTPSYGQEAFVESTIVSILNQNYPKLLYVVQDGGSKDHSAEIIARHADRLKHWESAPDKGQADAVRKGFRHVEGELGPEDVMAYCNSDDMIAPRALRFVAEYFATHPGVDALYGHRIIIDSHDKEVGRWIMPPHEADSIEWIDYVPQETLFWRKKAWDLAGGIDPAFQFALDWDLLARFHKAGCRIVRVPHFLGAFRIHDAQKTSSVIHTTGAEEMAKIRLRFHGPEVDQGPMIEKHARRIRFRGAVASRLMKLGYRW